MRVFKAVTDLTAGVGDPLGPTQWVTIDQQCVDVRFPSVKVGSRLRARSAIGSVTPHAAGHLLVVSHTVEIEGEDKPACVVETLTLLLGASSS